MSSDLNRRQWLLAGGRGLAGRRVDEPPAGPAQGSQQESPLLHQELGLPALGHRPQGRQARVWPNGS